LLGEVLEPNYIWEMQLAKNEREACQFIWREPVDSPRAISITVGDFKNDEGETLAKPNVYWEFYNDVHNGNDARIQYPDALVPYSGGAVAGQKLASNPPFVNFPFYIEIVSPKDAIPGDYTAEVKVFGDGSEIASATITATVWDFALPETPYTKTAFGIDQVTDGNIDYFYSYNGSSEKPVDHYGQSLYKTYYDELLDHRISAFELPYAMTDERVTEYINDPRVTTFNIPIQGRRGKSFYYYNTNYPESPADTYTTFWYKKARELGVEDKAYIYYIDEPASEEALGWYMQRYNILSSRLGGALNFNSLVPFFPGAINFPTTIASDWLALEAQFNTILVPHFNAFYTDTAFLDRFLTYGEDHQLWRYIMEPHVSTNPAVARSRDNFLVQQQGTLHRLVLWRQYQMGLEGLLYWNTVYWGGSAAGNPWTFIHGKWYSQGLISIMFFLKIPFLIIIVLFYKRF
jgi:hypothetical protein